MRKFTKDIGRFAIGSIAIGGGAAVVGSAVGGSYASGLAVAGGVMPVVGGLILVKHGARFGGKAIKALPRPMRPTKRMKRIFG